MHVAVNYRHRYVSHMCCNDTTEKEDKAQHGWPQKAEGLVDLVDQA